MLVYYHSWCKVGDVNFFWITKACQVAAGCRPDHPKIRNLSNCSIKQTSHQSLDTEIQTWYCPKWDVKCISQIFLLALRFLHKFQALKLNMINWEKLAWHPQNNMADLSVWHPRWHHTKKWNSTLFSPDDLSFKWVMWCIVLHIEKNVVKMHLIMQGNNTPKQNNIVNLSCLAN